jgi:hypothetical protein
MILPSIKILYIDYIGNKKEKKSVKKDDISLDRIIKIDYYIIRYEFGKERR